MNKNENYHKGSTKWVAGLVDNKCDPALGQAVRSRLVELGLETGNQSYYDPEVAFTALVNGIHGAYKSLGLDVDYDPSIMDTPKRFAKMFVGELTRGLNYDFFPKCTATPNGVTSRHEVPGSRAVSKEEAGPNGGVEVHTTVGKYDEMVLVRKIRTVSLCEHHLQTIDGFTHIAYLPNQKVIGLSKLARVAEFFAARPQIQERMTEQIYHALVHILGTEHVAVVVDAVHFCMRARGVKQPESWTQTNKVGGYFMSKPELRKEFFDALR